MPQLLHRKSTGTRSHRSERSRRFFRTFTAPITVDCHDELAVIAGHFDAA